MTGLSPIPWYLKRCNVTDSTVLLLRGSIIVGPSSTIRSTEGQFAPLEKADWYSATHSPAIFNLTELRGYPSSKANTKFGRKKYGGTKAEIFDRGSTSSER
jgi:hypothetical protein